MYLILRIPSLVSGANANKVYNAAPVVEEIQEIVLRADVCSDWEQLLQLLTDPRDICNAAQIVVVVAG